MNSRARLTATMFLIVLFLAGMASTGLQALPITEFDRLSQSDRSKFISLLLDGTISALEDEGKSGMARQLETLFLDVEKGEQFPKGFLELYKNIDRMRREDIANSENGKRPHVEHALIRTMRNRNIDIPKTITTIAKDFRPTK